MEGVLGITFKDFILLAADTSAVHSIILVKNDVSKIYSLSERLVMAVCGEPGDSVSFAEYVEKNINLYKMRNGFELSTRSAATFIRGTVAEYLRSRTPYQCNLILAGHDKNGPEMYYIDHLACMVKLPYGMHGYGAFFVLGTLDKYYRYDMNEKEAYELLTRCVHQVQRRLVVNLPCFKVKLIHKDGIRDLENIKLDLKAIGI
jgi:20S proteasome subunit beta 4